MLFAAAADKTERIRFGPNVTHVFLREPTLIVQQLATLDELTNGRIEAVVSTGNFGLMQQYGVDWAARKPLSRLKEAMYVMRTFLDDGKIDFKGDFFEYTGLFTAARPVQERMPLLMGGMKGPRSFIAAGEIADGMHHALSYSREAYDYVVENVTQGRRQRRPRLRRPRHRRLGRHRGGGGLRGGQAGGADPRRVLHLLDARGAARAPRHHARRGPAGGRRARARATSPARSTRSRPSSPSASRWPGRRRSAWRRSRPTSRRRA